MLHVTFETMENEETTILAEKSTILDGRRRENVELMPSQPPSWSWGSGWGLSSAIPYSSAIVLQQLDQTEPRPRYLLCQQPG